MNNKRLVISIATFNRPNGLKAVLDGIEVQVIPDEVDLRVVIIDNSQDANARGYVDNRKQEYPFSLMYLNERGPGITYPRNRGIEEALKGKDDYIIFTDDDVLVDKNWINELFSVAEETEAAAVSGAVKAKYKREPPWWIEKGGFFEVVDLPDRQPVEYGHTTNSLVRVALLRELNLRFDPFFSLTGGEDTSFFQAIRDAGKKTVFSSNAIVYECIGPERLTLSWWLKRWYRTGNTEGLIELREGNRFGTSVIFYKGMLRIIMGGLGSLVTLPILVIGKVDFYNHLRILSRGFGFLASVFGVAYEEYRDHKR
jgi:succinoglycan biosynthesis protein ExoM